MEYSIPVTLSHLGMNVKATETKLCDLLGQKLNTLCRVTKDDGLVDLELGKEGVQTVNFLLFLQRI